MNYGRVVNKAWSTVWRYRALWLFGVLLALTASAALPRDTGLEWDDMPSGMVIELAAGRTIRMGGEGITIDLTAPERPAVHWEGEWPSEVGAWVQAAVAGYGRLLLVAACAALALAVIVGTVTRYAGEAALIGMVDHAEKTGERLGVRQGLRLGWSRSGWRLFVLDVAVYGGLTLAAILLFSLALSPLALWLTASTVAGVAGSVVSAALLILVVSLTASTGCLAWILLPLARRARVIDGLGVIDCIRKGISVSRRHWRPVLVAWVVSLSLGIVSAFVLGSFIGAWRLVSLAGLFALFLGYVSPWLSLGAAGLGLVGLVLIAPFLFARGLVAVFLSNLWTLTYRELSMSEQAVRGTQPQIETSVLGAAQSA